MAVMKTCCGCFSTKSGTMAVLLLYSALYIAAIVLTAINLDDRSWYTDATTDAEDKTVECSTGEHKDTWWCKFLMELSTASDGAITAIHVGLIVVYSGYLVCAVLAIFGTSKGSPCFMLPWIIAEFVGLAFITVVIVLGIIILCVYPPNDLDVGALVAIGVIVAAAMVFLFYIWLCVVSHYQILREVAKLGLDSMENVHAFKNEDESEYGDGDEDEDDDEVKYKDNEAYEDDEYTEYKKDADGDASAASTTLDDVEQQEKF